MVFNFCFQFPLIEISLVYKYYCYQHHALCCELFSIFSTKFNLYAVLCTTLYFVSLVFESMMSSWFILLLEVVKTRVMCFNLK